MYLFEYESTELRKHNTSITQDKSLLQSDLFNMNIEWTTRGESALSAQPSVVKQQYYCTQQTGVPTNDYTPQFCCQPQYKSFIVKLNWVGQSKNTYVSVRVSRRQKQLPCLEADNEAKSLATQTFIIRLYTFTYTFFYFYLVFLSEFLSSLIHVNNLI